MWAPSRRQINALRADGTDKVIDLHNSIDGLKRDKIYTQEEKAARLAQYQKELEQAKAGGGQEQGRDRQAHRRPRRAI